MLYLQQITQENKERLNLLKGCEVHSINYEGCVYIEKQLSMLNENFNVIFCGEIIDTLDTNEKIEEIWEEFTEQELGEFDYIFD